MWTRLHRTGHTDVFGICTSQFPFRTDILGIPQQVAPNCLTASSITRGHTPLVFLQMHPCFKVPNHPCIDVRGGGSSRSRFLMVRWILLHKSVFANSTTTKLFSMEDAISEYYGASRKIQVIGRMQSLIILLPPDTGYVCALCYPYILYPKERHTFMDICTCIPLPHSLHTSNWLYTST
jgi:hypothetical protein